MRLFMAVATLAISAHCDLRAACWEPAARANGVEVAMLKAIAWQESLGYPSAVGVADPRTGNRAYGVMQIHSSHLPRLKARGITKEQLFDPCTNIQLGAEVLADCISKFGQKWKSVGCYFTGPASKNVAAQVRYAASVKSHYLAFKAQEQRQADVQFVQSNY